MKILLIEDDEFKARRIERAVRRHFPDVVVDVEKSATDGLRALATARPHVLLLDMSLTTFSVGPSEAGGRPQNFGGEEILAQLDRFGWDVPVIVITQYERFRRGERTLTLDDLRREWTTAYASIVCGVVYYRTGAAKWERELADILESALKKAGQTK